MQIDKIEKTFTVTMTEKEMEIFIDNLPDAICECVSEREELFVTQFWDRFLAARKS